MEEQDFAPDDAAANCDTGGDGVESAPLAVATADGGAACCARHGHAAWSSFAPQARRTATLEVTALDESGLATTAKAMPLLGVWAATDATGTPPTAGRHTLRVQHRRAGNDSVRVATHKPEALRFVITDARGEAGRTSPIARGCCMPTRFSPRPSA